MTSATLARYREALLAEALDLRAAIQRGRLILQVDPRADAVEATLDAAMRNQVARDLTRATKMLRAVDAALDRLDHGDYGVCAECGRDIPEKRLNAVPWADRCLAHAESRQRTEAVA